MDIRNFNFRSHGTGGNQSDQIASDAFVGVAEPGSEPGVVNISEVLDIFLRRWKVVAGCVLVCLFSGLALSWIVKPEYTASAQLLLVIGERIVLSEVVESGIPLEDSSAVESQLSLLSSSSVLQRVVTEQNLTNDPEFFDKVTDESRQNAGATLMPGAQPGPPVPVRQATDSLRRKKRPNP